MSNKLTFEPLGENYQQKVKIAMSIVFLFVVVVESSFLYIQAADIFINQDAEDVSMSAYVVLLVTNIFWIFYSLVFLGSIPVVLSSILFTIGTSLILTGIVAFGKNPKTSSTTNP